MHTDERSPWVFSSTGWTFSAFNLSLYVRYSNHLVIFVIVWWICYRKPISVFRWGAEAWTQHSRYGLSSAEQRGRILSLDLLATSFLIQPELLLAFFASRAHCWLMTHSELAVHHHLIPCPLRFFPASQVIVFTGTWVYSSPHMGLGIPLCWTSRHSCWPISPVCWGTSEWWHQYLFSISCKLPEGIHYSGH